MGAAQFNVQQVANLLWSMAISGRCDREAWRLSLGQVGPHCCCLQLAIFCATTTMRPAPERIPSYVLPELPKPWTEMCRKSCLLDYKLRCAKQQHNREACQMALPTCSWRPWQFPSPSCQQRRSRRWGIGRKQQGAGHGSCEQEECTSGGKRHAPPGCLQLFRV